jgi:hypothetical protein
MKRDSQFNVHGSVHRENIPIYIQQNAQIIAADSSNGVRIRDSVDTVVCASDDV